MKHLPKSQIEFEIIVPWKDWEKHLEVAASEASKEIKISGFRPGKAPRNLVEQKVGKGIILNGASERAVKKSYVDFVIDLAKKEKIEVIGSPKIEILEIEEGKDLKYKAVVAVLPKMKIEEDYKSEIKKINSDFKERKAEVLEKDLDLELGKLANSRVKLVTVRREALKNDSVEIDFEVKMGGVPIENGTNKNHPLIIGRGVFIPGFEEQIIGMKEGEEKEFELKFPESYHKKDLAGKPATFKVKMNLVQERQTPEINDEFAVSLGKFKNLSELKANIKEGMLEEKKNHLKNERRAKYLEEIIKKAEVDLPEILIQEEVSKMFNEFEYQLSPMGVNLEQYLSQIKKDKKDLEKDWIPEAEKRVKGSMALNEISKNEQIEIENEKIEEEMNKTLQYYKNVKDAEKNIDKEKLYNYCRGMLENEKVFEFLEKM